MGRKKSIFKIILIISLIAIIIFAAVQIRNTLARYESSTETEKNVDIAFWIVENSFQTQRLLIEDIYPDTVPYEYTFTVSNFSGSKSAETDMEYEIVLTATTNLPLSYEITKNGTACQKTEELYTDTDGTYYREIKLETNANSLRMDESANTTDTFVVKVTFPKENSANLEYADLIEYIQLDLSAKQVNGE